MMKRVYKDQVQKWAVTAGIPSVSFIFLLFMYLNQMGAMEVLDYTGDYKCAGTLEDPCYAFINFTAKENIYIYPLDRTILKKDYVMAEFEPDIKAWKIERSWGNHWRTIYLNQTATSTVSYAVKFKEGETYNIRITGYKHNPWDKIKWTFGSVDPIWDGVTDVTFKKKQVCNNITKYKTGVIQEVKTVVLSNYTWVNQTNPENDTTELVREFSNYYNSSHVYAYNGKIPYNVSQCYWENNLTINGTRVTKLNKNFVCKKLDPYSIGCEHIPDADTSTLDFQESESWVKMTVAGNMFSVLGNGFNEKKIQKYIDEVISG